MMHRVKYFKVIPPMPDSSASLYTIRPPRPDELDRLVDFSLPLQARPETRCLHMDWTAAGIRADVQDLDVPFESAFRFALAGDKLVGLLGADLDLGSGRGWLHGPFARDTDWEAIVGQLFAELWQRLPAEIGRVSNYLELAFVRGLDFHARFGFVQKGVSHIYRAARRATAPVAGVGPFAPADTEALCRLHAQAFPQTWISGPEMIAAIDPDHPLLIARHEGQAAGYIRLNRHVSLSEGSVDFVAVEPGCRGQGIGRRLLEAGLDWIFATRGLETALLNVSDSNANARQLYESAGFTLFQSGAALDWWRV